MRTKLLRHYRKQAHKLFNLDYVDGHYYIAFDPCYVRCDYNDFERLLMDIEARYNNVVCCVGDDWETLRDRFMSEVLEYIKTNKCVEIVSFPETMTYHKALKILNKIIDEYLWYRVRKERVQKKEQNIWD